ncbi:MAG TPA: hypothetical protein DCP92_16585 [Nitrospiraceae bacterium]|jgi:hypothetical protein|nr:hypothetical protein [Nitrospiraceae bacterium]
MSGPAYFDTPIATDLQSTSQGQMRTNFSQANTSFGVDHVNFANTSGNTGKHNWTTYLVQGSDPSNTSGQDRVYAKSVTYPGGLGTFLELFMLQENNATPIPLTGLNAKIGVASSSSLFGGGLYISCGNVVASTGGAPVTFARAFPHSFVACVLTTNGSFSGNYWYTSGTPTGMLVFCSTGSPNVNYIAIGT